MVSIQSGYGIGSGRDAVIAQGDGAEWNPGGKMMEHFHKGLKLYAFAREKAREFGLNDNGIKLEALILAIQEREGNRACFRRERTCPQLSCCWQASCGARMVAE